MISVLIKIGFKLVEWILNRSKMKKEEVKLFMQFLRKAQASPQASVSLNDILKDAEANIIAQEKPSE